MSPARRWRWSAALVLLASTWLGAPAEVDALPRDGALRERPGEPGSGLGRDPGRGNKDRLSEPPRLKPKTPEDAEAVAEFERIFARYREADQAAADSITQIMLVEAAAGRQRLEERYGREIKEHKLKARKLRADAIARYEAFVEQRPNSPTWTPEVMIRLAELHFEEESERYAELEKEYEEALEQFTAKKDKPEDAQPPTPPRANFDRAVALYRRVALEFPKYAHADAALYMMGILLFEAEDFEGSRQSLLALTCADRYPVPLADNSNIIPVENFTEGDYAGCAPLRARSKYLSESWLRIGEAHYDVDEFEPALAAYIEAARDESGALYDEALVRVAWTHYLLRDFPTAAAKLDDFVKLVDRARRKKSRRDAGGAAELRDEAIRYIAKCYVEEDWDLDGNQDSPWGFARLERDYKDRRGERHVPEIYAKLGELFSDNTDFKRAINIWDTALQRWPLAAAAPLLQKKIMEAQEELNDDVGARKSREALATNYLRGTKWFYANESDPDAIDEAMKLVEEALVATAVEHHALAQKLREQGDPKAAEMYRTAARAYEAYLGRYPDSPNSYRYRFDLAESLFYSEQYLAAADQYTLVRDDSTRGKYQGEAAKGLVFALEAYIESEKDNGRLELPPMPKKGEVDGPFDAKEIPELMARLQEAYDRVVLVDPSSEDLPTLRFNAATISHRYFHFGDSQARFEQILADHCASNVAINAGFAIIDSYVVRDDYKGTQEWTAKIAGLGCGEGEEKEKFAGSLKTLGLAARFAEANELLEAGEYEAAADRYVALVAEDPKDDNADRALNNAAVAYEKIGRFGSASKTYQRIYTEYPDSEFADDALLRTGLNHVRFFEFDEAVAAYLTLAEDQRYKESEHRDIALKNAAELLDSVQQYKKSADLYNAYAAKVSDPAEAADA
ncbi:MAG: tetratricopeptide repeat protein, partial [Myxococcales bacterium]|nr:tetratricopeptide repeat protein [Myxococcales bacterium]